MQRQKVAELHKRLLRWYRREGRTFPWRETRDPYRILVSEVMLQQTQTSRVHEKYQPFLIRFPTIHKLARARRRSVVLAWRGMGYNNRAVRLHLLAGIIHRHYKGAVPQSFDTLNRLPGIGRYTANALLSFAFRQRVPVVDTNVSRVLSRVLFPLRFVSDRAPDRVIWDRAEELLPSRGSAEWNQALMDLGATVCTARLPRCSQCPIDSLCSSAGSLSRSARRIGRREPSFRGIPDRIHRGRVVELLRGRKGTISAQQLGRVLHGHFGRKDAMWLRKLLGGLERDGLITSSAGRVRLA